MGRTSRAESGARLEERESSAHPIVGREQPVANQIIERARPGLLRVATHIGTHGGDGRARRDVADVDVHIEDQIGYLLDGTGDREFGAQAFGHLPIAAAAALQVAGPCLARDGRDVDEREPA